MDDLLVWVLLWVAGFGIAAALIGPRKGFTPFGAFTIGALFGIFGVAWLALREDA